MTTGTLDFVAHAVAWQGIQIASARHASMARLLDELRDAIDHADVGSTFDSEPSDFEYVLETWGCVTTARSNNA